mgnify:CR=1 FL=1
MNLIAWIFYIIQKVMVVPVGSANELKQTQEDADNWYKTIQKEDHKLYPIYKKVLSFWAFKLFLLVFSIWLIPKLRDVYNGKSSEEEMFTEGDEIGFKK